MQCLNLVNIFVNFISLTLKSLLSCPYKCVTQVRLNLFIYPKYFVSSRIDSSVVDQELPRMLRACYLYALYEELCERYGDDEGKKLCSRILQV